MSWSLLGVKGLIWLGSLNNIGGEWSVVWSKIKRGNQRGTCAQRKVNVKPPE